MQSYRQLSLTEHPDKNKAENATATFQKITKAFEVLTGNESRKLFDYYLDHPTVCNRILRTDCCSIAGYKVHLCLSLSTTSS